MMPFLLSHRRVLLLLLLATLCIRPSFAEDVLVPARAVWQYLDDGSDQGTAWQRTAFNDDGWLSGPAQLGYGDNDEATVLRFGPSTTNKSITTYFRHSFTVPDASAFTSLSLELLRDDGAVVYLNEREIFRSNMPASAINYRTLASTAVGGVDESAFFQTIIAASNLVNGPNVLAVEVHQATTNSSDVSFDLKLLGIRPPMVVTLVSPSDSAAMTSSSVTLNAAVTSPAGGNFTAMLHGRVGAMAAGPDFTLVAIPDTQYYVSSKNGGTPAMFVAQTDWIVAHRAARNIAFVTQLGDCVENGDNGGNNVEWLAATNALYRLENPLTTLLSQGLPYGVAVGNHDQSGGAAGTTAFYNQFFGETHFAGHDYYGGHFGANNDNHYELFSASGLDFIIMHLEYDPAADPTVLRWADGVLQAYAGRRALVVTHWLINAGNPASFSAQGQAIYTALRTNANLFLMLGGHVSPEEGQRQDNFNGHTVYSLMSDYQSRANGGNGWLRLMEFSPSNNVIRVQTFSPTLNQFETDASSQFDLPYDMRTGSAFTVLATRTGGGAQSIVSADWFALPAATPCEWFVTVSDGTNTTTSPVWRFFTASAAEPPALLSVSLSFDRANGRVTLTWPSRTAATYRVVCKSSLLDAQWLDLSEEIFPAGPTTSWSEPLSTSAPCRIYAIRITR